MTWKTAQAEAMLIVEDAIGRGVDLDITEYMSVDRYYADNPGSKRHPAEHNMVVRAVVREAVRRGVYCRRRMV